MLNIGQVLKFSYVQVVVVATDLLGWKVARNVA